MVHFRKYIITVRSGILEVFSDVKNRAELATECGSFTSAVKDNFITRLQKGNVGKLLFFWVDKLPEQLVRAVRGLAEHIILEFPVVFPALLLHFAFGSVQKADHSLASWEVLAVLKNTCFFLDYLFISLVICLIKQNKIKQNSYHSNSWSQAFCCCCCSYIFRPIYLSVF